MKRKLMLIYIGITTIAVIALSVLLVNTNNENKNLEMSLDSITPEITQVIITPEPTQELTHKPTFTPTSTEPPAPTRTPYEQTEEDIAFKESVIAEGKIITLEISEWNMIDIFCNKMGWDEYTHRFSVIDEDGIYYLEQVKGEILGNQIMFGIDSKTGDIVFEENGITSWWNIFYKEVEDEPLRYTDEQYIEIFIIRILKDDYSSDEVEVYLDYTAMGDMYFYTKSKVDGSSLKDYWVDWGTWEIWDEDYDIFYGTLFD